jgi:hypothetical protein
MKKNRMVIKRGSQVIMALTYLVTVSLVVYIGLLITGGISLWLIPLNVILILPVFLLVRETFGRFLSIVFGFAYGIYLDIWGKD